MIFDDVEIPWENILFYRHTRAAQLHPRHAAPLLARSPSCSATLRLADLMIGAALHNVRQTGLEKQQAVQEKLAQLACYREGINAHLTAAIALAEDAPGRPADAEPVAALLTAACFACSQLHEMMHIARELCGGQICVTPDAATFADARDAASGWRSSTPSTTTGGRRSPPAAGVRARPAELGLRGAPADVPAVRAVAAVRAPGRRLPHRSTGTARWRWSRTPRGCPTGSAPRTTMPVPQRRSTSMSDRTSPAATCACARSTPPTPTPSSSSATTSARPSSPATRSTCAARSAQDLDTPRVGRDRRSRRPGRAGDGQHRAAAVGVRRRARPHRKCHVYLTDIRYREAVYQVLGEAHGGRVPGLHRPRRRRRWRGPSGSSRSTATAVIP